MVVFIFRNGHAVAVLVAPPLVKRELIAQILTAGIEDDFKALQPLDAVNDTVRALARGARVEIVIAQLAD